MAVYRFRVTFEDYDDVIREIDIKSNQTFEDMHKAIHRSTGYAPDRSSSFYVSNDYWIKGDEISFMPDQRRIDRGVVLMEKSKLSNFIEDPHQKFYYTYNFSRPYDFHVELIKIILDTDPNIEYPFLVKSVGDAPRTPGSSAAADAAATAAGVAGVAGAAAGIDDFDFLNDMEVIPEDTEVIESMGDMEIETKDDDMDDAEEENDEFSDEFSDNDNYEDDGYGSKDDY